MTDSTAGGPGRAQRIYAILTEALDPIALEVRDDSEKHVGHGGWREEGETHFHVVVESTALNGLSRVAAQRKINNLLKKEFECGLHALSMQLIYQP